MAVKSLSRNSKLAIPELPKYVFRGKIQPPAFSRGALAVAVVLQELDVKSSEWEGDAAAAAVYPRFASLVQRGGDFGDGALAALVYYAASSICSGTPNMDVWVPFLIPWRGDNSEIPPDDCMFFEADGEAYSVEPNLHTLHWYEAHGATAKPVEEIRSRAGAISREEFEILRGGPVAAAKADASLQAFIASLEKAGHD